MMLYSFPLLSLDGALADAVTPEKTTLVTKILEILAILISGGLLGFFANVIKTHFDDKANKRDNRSEIEKTFTENTKELMDSYDLFTKNINERLTHVEAQLKEKDIELNNKEKTISELKEKAEILADEIEKLMTQNKVLIEQNKELQEKNIKLMEQNQILINRLTILGVSNN